MNNKINIKEKLELDRIITAARLIVCNIIQEKSWDEPRTMTSSVYQDNESYKAALLIYLNNYIQKNKKDNFKLNCILKMQKRLEDIIAEDKSFGWGIYSEINMFHHLKELQDFIEEKIHKIQLQNGSVA